VENLPCAPKLLWSLSTVNAAPTALSGVEKYEKRQLTQWFRYPWLLIKQFFYPLAEEIRPFHVLNWVDAGQGAKWRCHIGLPT